MKLVKFFSDGKTRWGALGANRIDEIFNPLRIEKTGREFDDYELMAPFFGTKVICLGLNYESHVEENRTEKPKGPILFSKAVSSITAHESCVVKPEIVKQLDYEAELAFVIGRKSQAVPQRDAYEHIAGYTVLNDISARDLQFGDKQWFRGKSCDTFCPLGPWIVDKNEIEDPMDLQIEMRVNGEVRQSASTKEMIFDIPYIMEYITKTMTLMPGDVVATGTPAGVGAFRDPPLFLKDGDVMEAEIERIGVLRNRVAYTTQTVK
jgi:2-keto-4-pentenoate hydratase/2-oxohepta-3-ene-1,7-dioic acid hydratase in catechol pathway